MAALLLALLLTLLLDQGTATQHRIARFGDGGAIGRGRIAGLVLMVAANAIVAAILGAAVAIFLLPDARLLFFAIALSMGGAGLLIAPLRKTAPVSLTPPRSGSCLIVGLALRRAGENAAFATAGVVVFTGAPLWAAIGATLGGWAALFPPLMLGTRYRRQWLARAIPFISGGLLLCLALACGVSALRIV